MTTDNSPDFSVVRLPKRRKPEGLRKEERLSSRTMINRLYDCGRSISVYPLRGVFLASGMADLQKSFRLFRPELVASVQMMVSVPKKRRRLAVDRVLMRRRIREAWRRNRHLLESVVENSADIFTLSVGIVYMAERNHSYRKIEERIRVLISKIADEIR